MMIGTTNQRVREEWLKKTLQNIPPQARILDAGAGELKYKSLCAHLRYTSQDFALYDGKGDEKALQQGGWDQTKLDIVSDITDIPRDDGSFDAIMCIEVLEHLPEPVKAIQEFSRLLDKNGALILTAPFCSLTHFAPYHFSTGFNTYFYEEILKKCGFEIVEITPNGNYYEYIAQEVRRLPWVVRRYSQKKIGVFGKLASRIFLMLLAWYGKTDHGSQELLCFGYQVLARKID